MPQVQARLDLPVRKTRSSKAGKVVTPVKVEEVSEEKVKSTRSRRLLQPIEDPESLMRTPRSKRKTASKDTPSKSNAETPSKVTTKRAGGDTNMLEKETKVSPSKQARTPLKQMKENVPVVGLSPCSGLSRLALASPKVSAKKSQRGSTKTRAEPSTLTSTSTSPPKLTADDVSSLLDSPVKSRSPRPKTPSRKAEPTKSLLSKSPKELSSNQLEDILCSPKVPAGSGCSTRDPSRAAANLFLSPSKPAGSRATTSSLFPTKSPRRVTSQELEDLLCSPVKSPAVKMPSKSPRKPATPSKRILFSPVKTGPAPAPARPAPVLSEIGQFQEARAALHTGTPSQLLCREEQIAVLDTWLQDHLVAAKPGSLYISGAPGTGKTAILTHLLSKIYTKYKYIFINCMVLKSSIAIYREVAKQLCPKKEVKTERDALKVIEASIQSSGEMILLVLDEVDQLETKDQSVLYTVFEWPALERSRLVLCGIANSLDLTDRVLPRLQVSPAYKPSLLHYPPYSKQQIMDILTARLQEGAGREGTGNPVITTRAIAFLAGKIASLSGDLRKALDVCRRALELSETIARKQSLLKPTNPRALASPAKSPRKGYLQPKVAAQAGQVDVPQIMKVINQVYGSQVAASLGTKGDGLPLKQKILMASLLLMVKKGRTKEVTLGKLSETYAKILKRRQMEPEHESACVGEDT